MSNQDAQFRVTGRGYMGHLSDHQIAGLEAIPLAGGNPAVTLEGLAAVITAVNTAVVAMGFGDEKNAAARDLLALIAKAREVACGKANESQTTPEPQEQTRERCRQADLATSRCYRESGHSGAHWTESVEVAK